MTTASLFVISSALIWCVNLGEKVAGVTSGKKPRGATFPLPAPAPSSYCSSRNGGEGDGGIGVQLKPGSFGLVALEVPQREILMLANGLKRLSVNVVGLLGGHVCQMGYKPNWC